MENKIWHVTPTQSIPDSEFKPLKRGESPYFGNLNRPSQSAYDLAAQVSKIQSWGGFVSILSPGDINHTFKLYDIVRVEDNGVYVPTTTDVINTRYGIVVAEAEIDTVYNVSKNIVVCTFCPNFIYPSGFAPSEVAGGSLYLDITDSTWLSNTHTSGGVYSTDRILAKKTGVNSMFFSGTSSLW